MARSLKLAVFVPLSIALVVATALFVSCKSHPQNTPPRTPNPADNFSTSYISPTVINAPGNYTAGTVAAVKGITVTITDNVTKSPVTVTVGPNTVITKGTWVSVSDLKGGERAAVSGNKNNDGMISATFITIPPPSPPSGNDTVGILSKVDGNMLTLTDSQNQDVKINVVPGTPIYLTLTGKLTDVTVGSQVNVRLKPGDNNQITATWIVIKASPQPPVSYVSPVPSTTSAPTGNSTIPLTTFNISNVLISPKSPLAGQPAQIKVDVRNTGGQSGVYSLNLSVNSRQYFSQNVSLEPGDSTTISSQVTENVSGIYVITVGGKPYTIIWADDPAAAPSPPRAWEPNW